MRRRLASWLGGISRWRPGPVAILMLLLALLAVKGLLVAGAAWQAKQDGSRALAALSRLEREPIDGARLSAAASALELSARSLQRLQDEVKPLEPLLGVTRRLPSGVSWLSDVPDALAVAVPLVQVGAAVAPAFSTAVLGGEAGQGSLGRYLAVATTLAPLAPEMAARLDTAEEPMARLRGRPLGGVLEPLGPYFDRVAGLLPAARWGLELLEAVGPAVGTEGPRSYLLLGQNSGEMRATGGFIGSAGTVTLLDGAVIHLEYRSSYALDAGSPVPAAPAPLARYLGLGGWYLRDSNWWPDFPATATQVEQAWQRAGHGPVDGVIAFDTAAVEALLGIVGTVEVAGRGAVTASSFERAAAEQLYSRSALASAEAFHRARGEFLGAVGRALVERLLHLSPSELLPAGKELLRLLEQKHVQVAFKDQRIARVAQAEGWDGAIPPVAGDSLYVVDSTVSYGDTYGFVRSATNLRINLEENSRQDHDLVLDYFNRFPQGLPPWMPTTMVGGAVFDPASARLKETPGLWGNWLRVYLPPDAHHISVEGLADPAPPGREFGRVVVAGHFSLSPGQRRTVRIRYATSDGGGESGGFYRLYYQKQAGLECRPVSLDVLWPEGRAASYRDCPTSDRWIEVGAADRSDAQGGLD